MRNTNPHALADQFTHRGGTCARPAAAEVADASPGHRNRLLYEAFLQLHEQSYFLYARARLHADAPSQLAVASAVQAIGFRWAELLRQPRTATEAWRQLRCRVAGLCTQSDSYVDRLYEICSPDGADIILLKYGLRLPLDVAANVMGVDRDFAAAGLRSAERCLPLKVLEHLEEVVPRS